MSDQFNNQADADQSPAAEPDRLAILEAKVDRIIRHLDPMGTSRGLQDPDDPRLANPQDPSIVRGAERILRDAGR